MLGLDLGLEAKIFALRHGGPCIGLEAQGLGLVESDLGFGLLQFSSLVNVITSLKQESPAVADKPARRLRKVCTVYVRAVGL